MMDVMRLSAAHAMKLTIAEPAEENRGEGLITANDSVDRYVGTAWDVPVTIGTVKTNTHFRIVQNLTQSVILGAPWCASSQVQMIFRATGRCLCCITSSNRHLSVSFVATDPNIKDASFFVAKQDSGN
jgi:hypothetical protein